MQVDFQQNELLPSFDLEKSNYISHLDLKMNWLSDAVLGNQSLSILTSICNPSVVR